MNTQKPLVSVIIPVHNSGKFLQECFQSLTQQSYRNIEIIAIDDFSSDNSLKILRSFAKKYKKVRVYRNVKRYGIGVTLNRLTRKAKGEFLAFAGSEDVSSKERIKKQIQFLLNNQDVVALGSQCYFIKRDNKRISKSNFPLENRSIYNSPLHGVSMQFETIMINRNLIPKDLIKFRTDSTHFVYSDILMKILPYGKFANLPSFLHSHRNNPEEYFSDLRSHIVSLLKLWITSIANYNYQLSAKSFFTPLIKQG